MIVSRAPVGLGHSRSGWDHNFFNYHPIQNNHPQNLWVRGGKWKRHLLKVSPFIQSNLKKGLRDFCVSSLLISTDFNRFEATVSHITI